MLSSKGEMRGVRDHNLTVLSLLQLAMVKGRLWWQVKPAGAGERNMWGALCEHRTGTMLVCLVKCSRVMVLSHHKRQLRGRRLCLDMCRLSCPTPWLCNPKNLADNSEQHFKSNIRSYSKTTSRRRFFCTQNLKTSQSRTIRRSNGQTDWVTFQKDLCPLFQCASELEVQSKVTNHKQSEGGGGTQTTKTRALRDELPEIRRKGTSVFHMRPLTGALWPLSTLMHASCV